MPSRTAPLDRASIRLLEALQTNSEVSVAELADLAGLSTSPCWRRINELKARGVITRCVAIVDPLALGLAVNVFVHVSLERQDRRSLDVFDAAVRQRPEVMECYLMSGESDYLLRVVVEDLIEYQSLMIDFLTRIPGVASIRSSFALSQVKYTTALPTAHLKRSP
ncbi:Lrp/AsnC family transcriptional regulator [Rhodospirillum rubrum]|uniref:Transcriptional regulator, AsnC family n=1 Tax=Rhodospirillum rubrum (strain ATCC 11170 / ATH 1.1.1 / DSM 467 / LMG 4362 / NCIMB 8255 / S1) TaxID=269796 RepID=Q2RXX4_RHORT|nr:Lrp/AsnC family transcriptional regulator [Rhodospirillum rubrum]ABC21021.1 transcriptional regulator, AsnC family [Rhodospirillum rubrum ATCC 11170]AEO46687.1 AsnC family transcriptional regulator [Rhodospirillum rubrum F11]MBK1665844.1 Lrp/AsnC family transcriptional regulator [Rhodospirillum rubrum]MBK1677896.1 Lrp/AsnC family transcriptional regulator [Rhodospirillum rubrum]MBK5952565.1 Lrp/AsnC family transcriptional regulator [Rhodospirillum rubrum]